MKKFIGKLLGVVIGVTWVLALTLKFWGPEFYKIVPAIFSGIIIGLFIADYKEAWNIIIDSKKIIIDSKSIFPRAVTTVTKFFVIVFKVIVVILMLIYTLLVWVVSIILGMILSPLYILKQVARSEWSLLIALSITIGGLLGTVYNSYLLGLTTAVIFFSVLSAIKKLLSAKYLNFFFYYDRGLPGYATFHVFK